MKRSSKYFLPSPTKKFHLKVRQKLILKNHYKRFTSTQNMYSKKMSLQKIPPKNVY